MNVQYILSSAPVSGALDVEYGAESGLTVYENLDVLLGHILQERQK